MIGAYVANILYLPRVIGMLVAGILLRNIPWGAIDSFPSKWGVQMRAAALATIFLRCGLELSFPSMNRYKFPALRLALIPGLCEAIFDAALGVAFFGMSYLLGLTMGFILKAVGPGLIVPEMFQTQKKGLGTEKGIPSIIVIAASFDDIVAITGYAIFSTIAIQPSASSGESVNTAWSIASGPSQVIFGIIGGILGGACVGMTRVWNTQLKRFLSLFFGGLLIMFFFEYFDLLSGGALGALFISLVGSNLWERGIPKRFSLGPSLVYSPDCERWMSIIWRWIMEPIMFVTVGSILNFSELQSGTIPKAVAIVICGVILRMLFTFGAMSGLGFSVKEKVFFSVAWTPKATVQAALSAAPLTLIESYKVGIDNYDEWFAWGNDILTTGMFAIIICGTLGSAAAHFCSPLLLKREAEEENKNISLYQSGINLGSPDSKSLEAAKHHLGTFSSRQRVPRAVSTSDAFDLMRSSTTETLERTRSVDHLDYRMPENGMTKLIGGEDLAIVAEYIDAIKHLTNAVDAGEQNVSRDEILRLSQHVLYVQKV